MPSASDGRKSKAKGSGREPKPPSRWLAASEPRALFELGWFAQSLPLLRFSRRGDGHPVFVLPGFLGGDASTTPLRRLLHSLGYDARGWLQGQNLGLRPGVELLMIRRLRDLFLSTGRPVSLVGWSLGGIYARELARQHPDAVRQVITLGSPFNLSLRANNAWRLYELMSGESIDDQAELFERVGKPLEVPATAVYTRTDGVAAWQCCLLEEGERAENVEVYGSHCGLGHNPLVIEVVSDRLAQPEDQWRPFERRGWRRAAYPKSLASPEAALALG